MVDEHSLVIALLRETELILEALTLVDWVIEFGVGIGNFLTIDHEFESLREEWIRAVLLGQRGHLLGVICDEGWLDIASLTLLSEEFVDELTLTHCIIDLYAEAFAGST